MTKDPHEQFIVTVMTEDGPKMFRFDNLLERDAFAEGVMQGLFIAGAQPMMDNFPEKGRTLQELRKTKLH